MADVRPFRALRPDPGRVARVAALPYDVMDVEEARVMAKDDPESFLHVSRPEIDLAPGIDPYSPPVYRQGRDCLRAFARDGVLVRDAVPAYYIYRQGWSGRVQTGVVACAAVADYRSGVIRTHEHTRPDKENDRVRHIDALDAHDEPVFLVAPRSGAISAVLDEVTGGQPEYDFVTEDGVSHTFWTVADHSLVQRLRSGFDALPRLYVADGHHRSAAAAAVHDLRGRAGAGVTTTAEHDSFPVVIFPDDEVRILPYNRVVTDLAGRSGSELLAALDPAFEVTAADGPVQPAARHEFGMYLPGRWLRLRARPGTVAEDDPIGRLDVSVLQDRLLGPLLGIADPRTDARIRFVGGIRGTEELVRLVDCGAAAVAFSLHPTSTRELLDVADGHQVMPPKSTWFEPKLRSGLFVHEINPING